MDYNKLAELLFPDTKLTLSDIISKYPNRSKNIVVTRMSPSPTGFLHIGSIYTALVDLIITRKNNGVFMLRIEDTDQKREVEGATKIFIDYFKIFGINFDEGPIGENYSDIGNYGPYIQSLRKEIYKAFIKELVIKGLAYPCFLSELELEEIRKFQEKSKIIPGIYGQYSTWRNANFKDIEEKIQQGEGFTIRLKSPGIINKRIIINDLIKGEIETIDNYLDIVLLKSSGLPTYHFAHIIDDYLMGTTHVIRGDEWLSSFALHLQLFELMGWKPPLYAHLSPLAKIDGNSKRKLSKRKDPEADVKFFLGLGYPVDAVLEYLANIINSGFEDRRLKNPYNPITDFDFKFENMNHSWALVDLVKLDFVSKEFISRLDINTFYDQALNRAEKYDLKLFNYMSKYPDYTKNALNIERGTEKDPKRFHRYTDLINQLLFFYDEEYEQLFTKRPKYPENLNEDIIQKFIGDYIENINLDVSKEKWFENLILIAKKYGFASTNSEFKSGGYIGKIGDIAMLLRIILCCSTTTPDLFETMKVMGKQRIIKRLKYGIL